MSKYIYFTKLKHLIFWNGGSICVHSCMSHRNVFSKLLSVMNRGGAPVAGGTVALDDTLARAGSTVGRLLFRRSTRTDWRWLWVCAPLPITRWLPFPSPFWPFPSSLTWTQKRKSSHQHVTRQPALLSHLFYFTLDFSGFWWGKRDRPLLWT
jgi:hypothetical protein